MPDISAVNQAVIIDKLIDFLELSPEVETTKEDIDRYTSGLCYGLSIVYSYMAATKKLNWWQSALQSIAQWDGLQSSLSSIIKLPNSNTETETLENIFTRAINYIVYNQGGPIFTMDNDQRDQLKVGMNFTSEQGEIRHHAEAAGNFSNEHLAMLLDPKIFSAEAIFVITNITHACSLRHSDSKWFFYDPNSKDGELSFGTKEELITELTQKLGSALYFQLASWNSNTEALHKFSIQYEDILASEPEKLIMNDGLELIIVYSPDILAKIIKQANRYELISHEKSNVAKNPGKKLRLALATAIQMRDKNDECGLSLLARYQPNQFNALIKLAKPHIVTVENDKAVLINEDKTLVDAIAMAITKENIHGENCLHILEKTNPIVLDNFLKFSDSVGISEAINEALDSLTWCKFNKVSDPIIFKRLETLGIEKILSRDINEAIDEFSKLINNPKTLTILLELAEVNQALCDTVTELLQHPMQGRFESGFRAIHLYAGVISFTSLMTLVYKNEKLLDAFINNLPIKSKNGSNNLHWMIKINSYQVIKIFKKTKKDVLRHGKLIKLLSTVTDAENNKTALEEIYRSDKSMLTDILATFSRTELVNFYNEIKRSKTSENSPYKNLGKEGNILNGLFSDPIPDRIMNTIKAILLSKILTENQGLLREEVDVLHHKVNWTPNFFNSQQDDIERKLNAFTSSRLKTFQQER